MTTEEQKPAKKAKRRTFTIEERRARALAELERLDKMAAESYVKPLRLCRDTLRQLLGDQGEALPPDVRQYTQEAVEALMRAVNAAEGE